MKIHKLFSFAVAVTFMQCNLPKEKFITSDYVGDYPIKDLITEVPALDEKTFIPAVLENACLKAVFDKSSGRFISFIDKKTGWHIQQRARLSRSFRLAVPVPGRRDNCVYGERQSPCRFEALNGNKKIVFTWDNLSSEGDKNLAIHFKGIVELTNEGLVFTASVDNKSPYTVEAVYWPYMGDIRPHDKKCNLTWMNYEYAGSLKKNPLYPYFKSQKGYYGIDYPIQIYNTQYTHFGLLGDENEGLYVGYHDTTDNQLVNFTFELKPGYEYTENTDFGTVSQSDSIGGTPVHIEYSCVHFVFVNPKDSGILKPILLQPYSGDWQKGADIYKSWRKTWVRTLPCPEWARTVHSWQQLQINSSEDYPRFSYKDLVGYGKECEKNGVKVILLTGWNIGGQDRGNPSHDIDPRLGSWTDLKNAISECQKLGVHVILFSKFNWADETQPWFKNELIRYAVKNPYGDYVDYWGNQYQTAVQLAGFNVRRLIPMCPLSSDWRQIADREFTKVIDLGADGMLVDECQTHGELFYCFDATHGHHIPANLYSGDDLLESGFRNITVHKKPEFLFAGKSIRDLQYRNYNVSYFHIGSDDIPMGRYVAPEAAMTMAVIGNNDRHPINQALLYRFIISYEPRNFKGRLDEIPLSAAYGQKVDFLREKYSNFLWDGEFVHNIGAKVKVVKGDKIYYSVFIDHKKNKKAVVVANPSDDRSVSVEVTLENKKGRYLMASPEKPEGVPNNGKTEIPALSVVLLMEK